MMWRWKARARRRSSLLHLSQQRPGSPVPAQHLHQQVMQLRPSAYALPWVIQHLAVQVQRQHQHLLPSHPHQPLLQQSLVLGSLGLASVCRSRWVPWDGGGLGA
jgi:hypothetical protein